MSPLFASLRIRLVLLVLLAVLPALGLILYTTLEQRRQLAAGAQAEALVLVKHSSADFEDTIHMSSQLLALLASSPEVRLQDWKAGAVMLADLRRKHPAFLNLGVVDRQGNLVCSAVPFTGALTMGDFAWFQRVRETLDFSVGDLQIGPAVGKPTVHCGYPVRDRQGRLQAAVFAALDLNWMKRLIPRADLPAGSVFAVIDREGHIMVRYPDPEAWVGKKATEAAVTQVILTRGQGVAEARGVDGVLRLYAFSPLEGLSPGGYVYVGISTAAVYAPATRALARNLLGLGLVAALALASSLVLGHLLVTRGMKALVRTARQVSAGSLEARSGLPYHGELGQLARALDDMAAALEQREAERQQDAAALRESEAKFRALVEQIPAIVYTAAMDDFHSAIYISPQVEEVLGFAPAAFHTDPQLWQRQLHPEDRARVLLEVGQAHGAGAAFVSEYRVLSRAGAAVWIRDQSLTVRDPEGRPRFCQGVMLDITRAKGMETALQQANEKLRVLVAETEERNRNITLLNEMSDLLQACHTLPEAFSTFVHFGPQIFPGTAGVLFLLNNSRSLYEAVGGWGDYTGGGHGFAPDECWAIRRGRLHLVAGGQAQLLCPHVSSTPATAHLCAPLLAQGEALGVLHLKMAGADSAVPEEGWQAKAGLAGTISENMSLSLSNLKLRETLRSQAIRDPLTGLFNRRYLEETLERELYRAKRLGSPVGMIMMDLDRFKEFNDAYGHHAGDALLEALGRTIQRHVRLEDVACRYGGEEFLLLLPGASLETALTRAEKLREAIKKTHLDYRRQSLKSPTVSLGVAVFPEHGTTAEEMVVAADAALYRAKKEGRDRVVVAGSPGKAA
jgi:diguanylate cyclase (GGDEF)-like protein/PAS domain S-box-containing protein